MVHPLSIRYIVTGFGGIDNKLGSIINVGVRKYSFLTPFLHKKVDIDGIHSYN